MLFGQNPLLEGPWQEIDHEMYSDSVGLEHVAPAEDSERCGGLY